MILEVYEGGPIGTHCILLGCERTLKGAIIDAPAGVGLEVLQRASELGLTIEMLLLTHSHWDHIADIALLKKKTAAPLFVHPLDRDNVSHPGSDGLPLSLFIEGVEADRLLHHGDQLQLGDLKIQVIHTPGHTPGGVCFYLPEEATLISGDTLFKGSIGRVNLPGAEPEKMWASLATLSKLPPDTRVIPGHGEETRIKDEPWLKNAKKYFMG